MFVTPVSWAITCWVRSAIRTASSVGSASASSKELVCSDWVPPSTPGERLDRRADDVDERLLGGQRDAGGLRVEAHPQRLLGSLAPKVSRSSRAQIRRAARYLAISSKKSMWALKKKESRGREVVDVEAALDGALDVGEAVLEREGELLLGGRAGLADVVAGDRDRVPARHLRRAPLDHVGDQPHRRLDREAPLLLGDVLLEDVGLDRAAELAPAEIPFSSAATT